MTPCFVRLPDDRQVSYLDGEARAGSSSLEAGIARLRTGSLPAPVDRASHA